MGINGLKNGLDFKDYQALFECVPGLYLILSPELTIIDASDSYLSATMTKRDDIKGKHLFEVFPDNPNDPSATGVLNLKASLNRVLQYKKADAMAVQKYDVRKPDGLFEERSWSPLNKPVLDQDGNVRFIIHRVEDVTEILKEKDKINAQSVLISDLKDEIKTIDIYKRAQQIQSTNEELRQEVISKSEEFEKLFQAVPVGIIGIDTQGIVRFSNRMAEQMFGYENGMMVKSHISQFIHCTDPEIGNQMPDLFFEENSELLPNKIAMNCIALKKNGGEFPFEINLSASHSHSEKIMLLSLIDISAQKHAELKLNEYIVQIENKNKELEQFTYIASHDLQEPLRSVSSFIELFEIEYKDKFDENARTYFTYILKSTERMKALIKGLLDYSRIGKGMVVEEIDCNKICEETKQDLISSIEETCATVDLGILPTIKGSHLHIRILFQNLVSNAIKFRKKDESPIISINCVENPNHYTFCVSDNGIGIEQKFNEKVFTIFQRLHSRDSYEGTGIGLAHCKKIVQLHGGDIWYDSEVNKGSKFYFTISKNL